jgi:hypothetical protein
MNTMKELADGMTPTSVPIFSVTKTPDIRVVSDSALQGKVFTSFLPCIVALV